MKMSKLAGIVLGTAALLGSCANSERHYIQETPQKNEPQIIYPSTGGTIVNFDYVQYINKNERLTLDEVKRRMAEDSGCNHGDLGDLSGWIPSPTSAESKPSNK